MSWKGGGGPSSSFRVFYEGGGRFFVSMDIFEKFIPGEGGYSIIMRGYILKMKEGGNHF